MDDGIRRNLYLWISTPGIEPNASVEVLAD